MGGDDVVSDYSRDLYTRIHLAATQASIHAELCAEDLAEGRLVSAEWFARRYVALAALRDEYKQQRRDVRRERVARPSPSPSRTSFAARSPR